MIFRHLAITAFSSGSSLPSSSSGRHAAASKHTTHQHPLSLSFLLSSKTKKKEISRSPRGSMTTGTMKQSRRPSHVLSSRQQGLPASNKSPPSTGAFLSYTPEADGERPRIEGCRRRLRCEAATTTAAASSDDPPDRHIPRCPRHVCMQCQTLAVPLLPLGGGV